MEEHELNRAQLIEKVIKGAGHLVILGAGASRALSDKYDGDKNGVTLPTMNELVEKVGLKELIAEAGYEGDISNFEAVYSQIATTASKELLEKINGKMADYFSQIEIPDEVTNYDLMLAGLRGRDFVVTFNWDPLLHQAHRRLVASGVSSSDLPHVLYLHGNVEIGYCEKDRRMGRPGMPCPTCGIPYIPTPLLYPVAEKDYDSNPFIKAQWDMVKEYMDYARVVTVYGYSSPVSDVAAISLLQEGWGRNVDREFEQFELIIRPGSNEETARDSWDSFIHTHHYRVTTDFGDSYICRTPRRTVEAWWSQNIDAKFIEENPYPDFKTLAELVEWVRPLIDAEKKPKP